MSTEALVRGELTVVPALFEHAQRVYEAMEAESIELPEYPDMKVYEGHLTNLFKRLLLSVPYYSKITGSLIGMGCIEQIRRGGGTAESRWLLWQPPELDAWKESATTRPKGGSKIMVLEQRLRDAIKVISNLEGRIERLELMTGIDTGV